MHRKSRFISGSPTLCTVAASVSRRGLRDRACQDDSAFVCTWPPRGRSGAAGVSPPRFGKRPCNGATGIDRETVRGGLSYTVADAPSKPRWAGPAVGHGIVHPTALPLLARLETANPRTLLHLLQSRYHNHGGLTPPLLVLRAIAACKCLRAVAGALPTATVGLHPPVLFSGTYYCAPQKSFYLRQSNAVHSSGERQPAAMLANTRARVFRIPSQTDIVRTGAVGVSHRLSVRTRFCNRC